MPTYKLTIEYDGTGYHGWQRQANARTLQETIETALAVMVKEPVRLIGSGRTDAGVHALGQAACFRCPLDIPPEGVAAGLNSLLPDDIVIHDCTIVPDRFHAQYDAKLKTYRYRILNRPLPAAIGRQYAWHVPRPLDIRAMQQAAGYLVGTHDFKSFEASGSPRSHTTRTVSEARVGRQADAHITFEITANGFLRFMVRNIMGTLADVGLGKTRPADFENILFSADRSTAGDTAPPHGLFLVAVAYEATVATPLSR